MGMLKENLAELAECGLPAALEAIGERWSFLIFNRPWALRATFWRIAWANLSSMASWRGRRCLMTVGKSNIASPKRARNCSRQCSRFASGVNAGKPGVFQTRFLWTNAIASPSPRSPSMRTMGANLGFMTCAGCTRKTSRKSERRACAQSPDLSRPNRHQDFDCAVEPPR